MKLALLFVALAGLSFFSTGCATPAYSGGLPTIQFPEEKPTGEGFNLTMRNWHYENRQMIDDLNSFLLFQPSSNLTKWNVH
ncbi:MAG TPA: hypothetical protein VGQ99_02770 [Tepidisphaeraceae bacterium]|jgi:hypothetical protein|nr:hypothetical protein [Tepidisphaeraceae bacterium]